MPQSCPLLANRFKRDWMVNGSAGLWVFFSIYSMLGLVRRSAGVGRVSRSVMSSVVKAMWIWVYQWSPVCLHMAVCADVRVGGFGFAKDVGVSGWGQHVGLSGSSCVVGSLSLVAMWTSNM